MTGAGLSTGDMRSVLYFSMSKKAFNSVPHVALLKHLQYLHINEYIVKWMNSYLLSREQFVGIDGCFNLSTSPFWSSSGLGLEAPTIHLL